MSKLAKMLKAQGLPVMEVYGGGGSINPHVTLTPYMLVEVIIDPDRGQPVRGPLCLHTFEKDGERYFSYGEFSRLVAHAKDMMREREK